MPRYFVRLEDSGIHDNEGQEFPDDQSAREDADIAAREMACQEMGNAAILVTDENGDLIYRTYVEAP